LRGRRRVEGDDTAPIRFALTVNARRTYALSVERPVVPCPPARVCSR
jgi:hypothetical protein